VYKLTGYPICDVKITHEENVFTQWTFKNEEIFIAFEEISKDESGFYNITATNMFGSVQDSFEVIVVGQYMHCSFNLVINY